MICFQDLGFRVWGPWFGFESFRHRFPPKANAGFTLQGQKRQSMLRLITLLNIAGRFPFAANGVLADSIT